MERTDNFKSSLIIIKEIIQWSYVKTYEFQGRQLKSICGKKFKNILRIKF